MAGGRELSIDDGVAVVGLVQVWTSQEIAPPAVGQERPARVERSTARILEE